MQNIIGSILLITLSAGVRAYDDAYPGDDYTRLHGVYVCEAEDENWHRFLGRSFDNDYHIARGRAIRSCRAKSEIPSSCRLVFCWQE